MGTPASSLRIRSTIIKVPDATPGLLFINGQQKPFTLEGVWKSQVAPAPNQTVDVDVDSSGTVTGVTVVDAQQLAKERMTQLSGVAQERGKEAAKIAQQGVGAIAARMGKVPLAAIVVIWIAWFFLPAASVAGGFTASMSFTFWQLLGIDFDNPMTLAGGGSHGFLGLLGLLAIIAPFAAPFITAAWASYLNAAPLAIVLIGVVSVYSGESKTFGQLAQMGSPNPFSWSWGLFVLAIAAVVLAAGALKKPSAV